MVGAIEALANLGSDVTPLLAAYPKTTVAPPPPRPVDDESESHHANLSALHKSANTTLNDSSFALHGRNLNFSSNTPSLQPVSAVQSTGRKGYDSFMGTPQQHPYGTPGLRGPWQQKARRTNTHTRSSHRH
jgi:hypothetical protein